MILPTSYLAALWLLVFSMVAWGSWANTQKLAGRWRYELYYYDFSIGVSFCAVLAAFTLGSLFPKELTFQDNFLIASNRQIVWGVAGGVVFNLANILLTAAVAVAGMAIAFPIVFGLAAVIGILLDLGRGVQDSPLLVFGGAALVVIAVVLVAFAYSAYLDAQRAAVKPTAPAGSRSKPPIQPAGITAARGVILSVLSGILMGLFHPLVELSREGESGVAAYGLGVLFGAGVFFSTILYVPFLCNFPLKGTPIELSSYFKGTRTHHMLGLLGGVIFMAGALSGFVVANAPARVQIGPALTYGLSQGAALLGALWGLTVWREFKGATGRVKMLLTVMILLLAAGLGMIAAGSK